MPTLNRYFLERPSLFSEVKQLVYCLYDSVSSNLDNIALVEEIVDNPKLQKLYDLLQMIFEENPKSRGKYNISGISALSSMDKKFSIWLSKFARIEEVSHNIPQQYLPHTN